MQTFKTSKCELMFVPLSKDAYDVQIGELCLNPAFIYRHDGLLNAKGLQGNWQIIGPLSTIPEDLAKGLVDECTANHYPSTSKWYMSYADRMCHQTAWLALQNIATHLGMNTNDNIYLLKKL